MEPQTTKPHTQTFTNKPMEERRRIYEKERSKFPECSPVVVTPIIEPNQNLVQKKYSVQSHVRVMDFIRILQQTYNFVNRTSGLVLFADKQGQRILLRGDELIADVYKRMVQEDGWLYLHFDTQKRFG